MTNTTLIIVLVVAVVVIAAVGAIGYSLMKRKRTEHLKERFGPEYERSLSSAEDQSKAESELRQREKRHREMKLRPLDREQREGFERRWSEVQQDFVDSPARAVRNADGLVTDAMSARGYPKAEFDQRADDLSVSYPELTQLYRDARRVATANADGNATTEDLRRAVTTYRSLVVLLVRDGAADERSDQRDQRDHDKHDGEHRDKHDGEHRDKHDGEHRDERDGEHRDERDDRQQTHSTEEVQR